MIDKKEIIRALNAWFLPGDVFEIRVLNAVTQEYMRPHTESGYFDYEHIWQVAEAVENLRSYSGIYVIINPVTPDLHARAYNRLKSSSVAASDKDIISRRWFLVDCDAVRKSGISSTDEEHEAALKKAKEIRSLLSSAGWPNPISLDSGNGAQMTYRIDLPADDDGLVKRVLEKIALASSEQVNVDLTVFNPARLWRLPGTMNCKGDSIPSRPHRMAKIIDIPENMAVVTKEQLVALAGDEEQSPAQTPSTVRYENKGGYIESAGFNIDDWVAKYAPDAAPPIPWHSAKGRKWIFRICPFDSAHDNSSAGIFEHEDGAISFRCHHNGCIGNDWRKFRAMREPGCYDRKEPVIYPNVDVSGILSQLTSPKEKLEQADAEKEEEFSDPGALPKDLLTIPGFIDEYTKFIMSTAALPNKVLSFCGAVAFLSYLLGRHIRDERNNYPNIYLISLANSGVGKNHARTVNMNIALNHNICGGIAEAFASGEGLEDALITHPSMLFQVDEIDTLFNTLKYAKESRSEAIIEKMLRIYSASNSVYKPRKRAFSKDKTGLTPTGDVIINPYLTILGTAIPKHFYESLSQRLLTNGLMARCMILDAGKRGRPARGKFIEEPENIKQMINTIIGYGNGGNLTSIYPMPKTINYTQEANALVDSLGEKYNELYDKYEEKQMLVPMAFWARALEKVCKLAIIYAVSADVSNPIITPEAVKWASRFVDFLTEQSLHLIDSYTYENPFDEKCKKVIRFMAEKGGKSTHSTLLRRMHLSSEEFGKIMDTMIANGTVIVETIKNGKNVSRHYQLRS